MKFFDNEALPVDTIETICKLLQLMDFIKLRGVNKTWKNFFESRISFAVKDSISFAACTDALKKLHPNKRKAMFTPRGLLALQEGIIKISEIDGQVNAHQLNAILITPKVWEALIKRACTFEEIKKYNPHDIKKMNFPEEILKKINNNENGVKKTNSPPLSYR